MSAPPRITDILQRTVYETTVRPKSRRAEGVNRPKSGYNNRFQRERTRNPPQQHQPPAADNEDPVDRPRTSRGFRERGETRQQSLPAAREGSITPRPKSGYGARRRSFIDHHDNPDSSERPRSRRQSRTSYDAQSRTPPPPPSGGMLQRERTFYDRDLGQSERPRTRQGRSQNYEPSSQPSTPRNTTDPMERPRTGRGRRRNDSHGEEYGAPEVDEPPEYIERPGTSRGRRKSLSEYRDGSPMERPQTARRRSITQPEHDPYNGSNGGGGGDPDILVLEEERPQTSRGKRRTHYPIDLSYMSPRQPNMGNSPSPTPRPPTGRRAKSSRKKRQNDPPPTPPYAPYERQHTATSISSSRPGSAFNRFQPLPAIGSIPSRHIHIPHAGSPAGGAPYAGHHYQPASGGENQNHHLNLSEQTQRLHLEDSAGSNNNKADDDFGGSMYQQLDRNIVLPPEPVGPGDDRMILAIKLPDGTRVQRGFYTRDTLRDVRSFAEVEAQLDFSNCELVCDVPRKVYKDLSINISESGLHNRTVLHVQLPDELC